MDALEAFEAAAKTVRSVGRAAYFYGVAVRGAWTEPFTTAEAARAEAARKALVDKEAEEEVAEPSPFGHCVCGSTSCAAAIDTKFYPRDPDHSCWCASCNPGAWWMVTCADCGDKRCPRASSHLCRCQRDAAPLDPSSTTISARQPEVDGEGPVGDVPPSPAGLPNIPAGDVPRPSPAGTSNPGEFAAVAVREVLAEPLLGGSLSIEDIDTDCWDGDDWYEWREHVAAQVARRINAAAADERVTDRLRDAGFHAAQMFEQHLKAEK